MNCLYDTPQTFSYYGLVQLSFWEAVPQVTGMGPECVDGYYAVEAWVPFVPVVQEAVVSRLPVPLGALDHSEVPFGTCVGSDDDRDDLD